MIFALLAVALATPVSAHVPPVDLTPAIDLRSELTAQEPVQFFSIVTSSTAFDEVVRIELPPPSIAEELARRFTIDHIASPSHLPIFERTVSRKLASGPLGVFEENNVSEENELGPKLRRSIDTVRNRWYDPRTGTFLTPDPMGYRDSSNLYAFCGGDPVNCSDPTGNAGIKKGSISYPDNPRPGETREQYVTRLAKSGQVSFMDAAMMGECYYTSQCGSVELTRLAQDVDRRVKAQTTMALTMEAVGIAAVFTGGAAAGVVSAYGGGALVATTVGGAVGGVAGQGTANLINGQRSSSADYAQSALLGIGGAYIGGAVMRGVDPGPLTIFRAPTPVIGSPAQLVNGRSVEAQQLAELQLAKNNDVWRPTAEDVESAAFKVIVGEPKYTRGGLLKGTIFDSTTGGYTEIKAGSSSLVSSYQLRLQVFRSLQTNTPYTIRTSRPVNPELDAWLARWGASVEPLK